MALSDALLSTFRTQQIANQQRQANQLQQERLDLSRQQIEQNQASVDIATENQGKLNTDEAMDNLYQRGVALDIFDSTSSSLDKNKITEALSDPTHENHAAMQRWLGDAATNSSLVKMPDGFGVTQFTQIQEGGPYQALGEYKDERGVFGQGVLTNDGGTDRNSPVTMFENAEQIADFADTFYKVDMIPNGKLGENYANWRALQSTVETDPEYNALINNAAVVQQLSDAGDESGARGLASDIADPSTNQLSLSSAILPGSDRDINSVTGGSNTGTTTPAGTRLSESPSVNALLDGANRDRLNLDTRQSREVRGLVNEYRQAVGAFSPDRSNPNAAAERATPSGQARINAAEKALDQWPRDRLAKMESELAKLDEPTSRGTARGRGRRWAMPQDNTKDKNRITAEIAEHKSMFGLEEAVPISQQITDPNLATNIEDQTTSTSEDLSKVKIDDSNAQQLTIDAVKNITSDPANQQAFATAMKQVGVNTLEDAASKLNLRDRQLTFAYLATFANDDAQRTDAYNRLMNIQVTGVEDITTKDAAAIQNDNNRTLLDQQANNIRISEYYQNLTERQRELTDDALGFYREVSAKMEEIAPSGVENYSDDERKAQIDAYTQTLLPEVRMMWDNAEPVQKNIYKGAILRVVSEVGQMAAGTNDGGFWEGLWSFTRDSAQVDSGDLAASSLKITEIDKNGRVVSFIKVDGNGNTQGTEVAMSNLAGFSRDAAAMLEILLLDEANTDSGT